VDLAIKDDLNADSYIAGILVDGKIMLKQLQQETVISLDQRY
jgi:hypothetical protein